MNKTKWMTGASGAASWAWGTSLIMGQQIAQERGLAAWIIWAVCNSLTMALFGYLFNKGYISKDVYRSKSVKIIAITIQLFCLLVQLNFINQQLNILIGNSTAAYIGTTIIGFIFVMIVLGKGLPTSMKTDVFQWMGAIASIAVILAVGLISHCEMATFVPTTGSGVMWGIWSGLILFAGPIGDVQHWQRAEADTSKKGYYLAAFLFGMYMLEVLGMAFFQFNSVMNTILLIAVLCVATSTIDSIAVALHEINNKYVGTGVALAMCVAWPLFIEMGILQLWSSFGVIRYAFAIQILLTPACRKGNWKIVLPIVIGAMAIAGFFAVNGQITVNSVAGIISLVVATAIFMQCIVQTFVREGIEARNEN